MSETPATCGCLSKGETERQWRVVQMPYFEDWRVAQFPQSVDPLVLAPRRRNPDVRVCLRNAHTHAGSPATRPCLFSFCPGGTGYYGGGRERVPGTRYCTCKYYKAFTMYSSLALLSYKATQYFSIFTRISDIREYIRYDRIRYLGCIPYSI